MGDTDMFVLSKELRGHEQDVRCACFVPPSTIATGSRDCTVRLWDSFTGAQTRVLHGHAKGVGAVCTLVTPEGVRIVSAGYDSVLLVWDPLLDDPVGVLSGHEDVVCAVAACPNGTGIVISGSWDKTARIWSGTECIRVLSGHTDAVWAVLVLPNCAGFVTGSDDKSVRMWSASGEPTRQCTGTHTARVRGLAMLTSGAGFLSCSNDCTVALWSITGDSLAVFSGHGSFVYSVAVSQAVPSEFFSSSEDRSVRVWRVPSDGANLALTDVVQSIVHPTTIWHCATLPDGGIVTCCGDGVARVWSRDITKAAPEDAIAAFEASLVSSIPTGAVGQGSGALDASALATTVGRYDGDVQVFMKADRKKCAYRWASDKSEWQMIGEVVDAPPGETVLDGKKYDRVFDVDLDGRKFKLGYNLSENPYMAAQNFIHQNELDQDFLDEIAKFIIEQTGGNDAPVQVADGYCDPFTGANRYIPGKETSSAPPKVPSSAKPMAMSLHDDVAPSERYVKPTFCFLPQHSCTTFPIANTASLINKLADVSKTVPQSLTEAEVAVVAKCVAEPGATVDATVIAKLLQWPPGSFLPVGGVLSIIALRPDLTHLLFEACHPSGADVFTVALNAARSSAAMQTIVMRLLANAFSIKGLDVLLAPHLDGIFDLALTCAASKTENCRQATASVMLNIAVMRSNVLDDALLGKAFDVLSYILSNELVHGIVGVGLLALGTLIFADSGAKRRWMGRDGAKFVRPWISSTELNVRECAMEVIRVLGSA